MRILIQECKKMLSVRLLLLLALFTVLFYNMFFELNLYPAGVSVQIRRMTCPMPLN